MAITEMNFASGGGASSADKVSCIDAQGNKSDVQTELNKTYDSNKYSDEETIIGKYVLNGIEHDLYRKIVRYQTTKAYSDTNIDNTITHGIVGLKKIVNATGIYYSGSTAFPMPLTGKTSSGNIGLLSIGQIDGTYIQVRLPYQSVLANDWFEFVLEYIKN